MVQVIQSNRTKQPSFAQEVMGGLVRGLPEAVNAYKTGNQQQLENQAVQEAYGINLTGIRDPETRQKLIVESLKGKQDYERQAGIERLKGDIQKNRPLNPLQQSQKELAEARIKRLQGQQNLLDELYNQPSQQKPTQQQETHQGNQLSDFLLGFSDEIPNQRPTPRQTNQMASEIGQGLPHDPRKIAQAAAAGNSALANIWQKQNESYIQQQQHQQDLLKTPYEPTEAKLEAERQSKFADEIIKDYKAAQESEPRLNQMMTLARSKKLSTPTMVKTLNAFGLPIGVLQNPLTETYQKLENDFVKDVSDYFPGQVRVYEAQTFMKTIPSLMNTDEGKLIVARNLQIQNEAKKIRYDAYKDILNENKGMKPRNMDVQVFERTKDKLGKLGQEFERNIETALDKYGPKVKMYNADRSKTYEIPQNNIQDAMQQGLNF